MSDVETYLRQHKIPDIVDQLTVYLARTQPQFPYPAMLEFLTAYQAYERGENLRANNQNDAALQCYSEAVEKHPSYHAYVARALTQVSLGNKDIAVADLNRAEEFAEGPGDQRVLRALRASFSSGGHATALQEFRLACQENPADPLLAFHLGYAEELADNKDEAIRCYRKAISLRYPRSFAAYNNLGHVLWRLNDVEAAATSFRKAIALCPTFLRARNNLVCLLSEEGELVEAMEHCRVLVNLHNQAQQDHQARGVPPSPANARELSDALLQLFLLDMRLAAQSGAPPRTLQQTLSHPDLIAAITADPLNSSPIEQKAFILAQHLQFDAALREIDTFIEANFDHPFLDDLRMMRKQIVEDAQVSAQGGRLPEPDTVDSRGDPSRRPQSRGGYDRPQSQAA